jgi:PPOX class probable F420-dependent enzyme
MDAAEAKAFLAKHHRGVLATFRRDGSPQMSPVAAGVDSDGLVAISSRETAHKVKNLRRDPRAYLCVFEDGWYGPWIQVEGHASVVALPEAMELLVDYYRLLAGEHPDWDDYRAAMERERRVLIRFAIERAGPGQFG